MSRKKIVRLKRDLAPEIKGNLPSFARVFPPTVGKVTERKEVTKKFCENIDPELIPKALILMFGYCPEEGQGVSALPLYQLDEVRSQMGVSLVRIMVGNGFIQPTKVFRDRASPPRGHERYQLKLQELKNRRDQGVITEEQFVRYRKSLRSRHWFRTRRPIIPPVKGQRYCLTRKGKAEIDWYRHKHGEVDIVVDGRRMEISLIPHEFLEKKKGP